MRGKNKMYQAKQGTHFQDKFEFFEADGLTPKDVSRYTFEAHAKADISDAEKSFEFSFDLSEADQGVVYLYVDQETSSALDLTANNSLVFDVEYTDEKGRTHELAYGKIKFIPEITK